MKKRFFGPCAIYSPKGIEALKVTFRMEAILQRR